MALARPSVAYHCSAGQNDAKTLVLDCENRPLAPRSSAPKNIGSGARLDVLRSSAGASHHHIIDNRRCLLGRSEFFNSKNLFYGTHRLLMSMILYPMISGSK